MAATNMPVTLDTPIVIKIWFRGQNKKFKLPLKDLGAHVLPNRLRSILHLQPDQQFKLERYSDSAGAYVTLDSDQPQVYKTLFRAAKAKLKLRLLATIPGESFEPPLPTASVPMASKSAAPKPSSSERLRQNASVAPVIACSPLPQPPAPKVESAGPASPPKAETTAKKLPRSFTSRQSFFNDLANASQLDVDLAFHKNAQNDIESAQENIQSVHNEVDLVFRPKAAAASAWVVYCNNCNHPMEDNHFHCGICDGGDYDLCPACVDSGVHCPGQGHWMVKRSLKDGCVVNSTTQRIQAKAKAEEPKDIPGAFTEEKPFITYEEEPSRTCNCCVKILPESEFVTCTWCDDYDLCLECLLASNHGHHPGHAFKAAAEETVLTTLSSALCNSGRNVRHSAVCDGCDKFIYGVRHKCLDCPDWDNCSDCVKNAKFIHPRHRFAPIYEALNEPCNSMTRHYGIYCDGPLCKDKENVSYIQGVRYKCAVCHDTDFCQNCQAHPVNKHNPTHPLIMMKTSVRNVSITTMNEDRTGVTSRLGDHESHRQSTTTETVSAASSANAATQVQTIVDMKPSQEPQVKEEKIEPAPEQSSVEEAKVEENASRYSTYKSLRDVLAEQMANSLKTAAAAIPKPEMPKQEVLQPAKFFTKFAELRDERFTMPTKESQGLEAQFIRDTIVDGSKICLGQQFVQVWTLRNPGPKAWPVGCSVRHVGGDNMLNIDNTRALSQADLSNASESNVIDRVVEAGEEMSFRVVMRAPQREGTAISYWRLKTADGMPFGHRLWCDISVVAQPSPTQAAPADVPATSLPPAESSGSAPMFERILQARLDKMKSVQQSHAQQLEQQKMERVQRVRKAAVERLLETRRAARTSTHQEAAPTAEVPIKQETAEVPIKQEIAEVPAKQETAELPVEEKPTESKPELQSSTMIFPQLDKESPESSTYQSISTVQPVSPKSPESPKSEKSTAARTVTVASDDEFFEDAESVALHSDDSFMTDEEYDILDASDEEIF